ncbi:FAD-binding domain-containing protein [Penicillium nucicola]|uniref:FAD-binding domain-containing protein n=1 Tax=Penicillium nucicola TaxID=1850975 RepID=UPI002545296F|nr:FAD-binding domain-containing protein [Penicillium nucicola]KAJ5757404.1 FAD-binding domain-containing protein [Penicillium nucicola]
MQIIWRDSSDSADYEQARVNNVFNLDRPNYFPRAVILATSAEHVIEAVKIAQQGNCQLAVRSGGHSIQVWSLQEHSILLDLGSWKEIRVDAESSTAKVTTSVTGQELNQYLQEHHDLMFPAGHCPDVGLGGFMLQGGQGWNCRNWGWAAEKLLAVEVVTAEGKLLLCNKDQHQDLYWAARGAGPLFPAIATTFHLQLLPYPVGFRSSVYLYPARMYRTAFDWVQSVVPTTDQDTEIVMVAFHSEPDRELCFQVVFVTMKNNIAEAEEALMKLHIGHPLGTLSEKLCQEESLENLHHGQAMASPKSLYYYTDNAFIDEQATVTEVLEDGFLNLPPGKSWAFWCPMYPRSERVVSDMAMVVPSNHYFSMYSIAETEDQAPRCKAWVDETIAGIKKYAVGSYIGEGDLKQTLEWYWGAPNARRLQEVRQLWDPTSLFSSVHQLARR